MLSDFIWLYFMHKGKGFDWVCTTTRITYVIFFIYAMKWKQCDSYSVYKKTIAPANNFLSI